LTGQLGRQPRRTASRRANHRKASRRGEREAELCRITSNAQHETQRTASVVSRELLDTNLQQNTFFLCCSVEREELPLFAQTNSANCNYEPRTPSLITLSLSSCGEKCSHVHTSDRFLNQESAEKGVCSASSRSCRYQIWSAQTTQPVTKASHGC